MQMRSILATIFVLTLAMSVFAEYENYDLAPGAVPGIGTGMDPQWDMMYSWQTLETLTGGDNGLLGIAFSDNNDKLWVSGRGVTGTPHKLYVLNPYTNTLEQTIEAGTTGSWGLRDLCYDGTYIVGGYESGVRFYDAATFAFTTQIPFPAGMSFPRAIAYDPATDHFYGGNFASTCYEFTRQSTVVRQWAAAPLAAIYGMAWDDTDLAGPWLWVHDQTSPVSGCNVHKFDPSTLTYTGFSITLDVPPSVADMAGGLEYTEGLDPVWSQLLVFNQGTPDAGAAFAMYVVGTPPVHDWMITLTPTGSTTIPAGGGVLSYHIEIANLETASVTGQVWLTAHMPAGTVYNIAGPISLTIAGGASVIRDKNQNVPAGAPAGAYTFDAYCGFYPTTIWDEGHIPFTKSAADNGGVIVHDWLSWGEALPGETISEAPTSFAMMSAYPNPFNPSAFVSFTLPADGKVLINVYDIQGRLVTNLADGWVNAGQHKVMFDGSNLSSGVYLINMISANTNLTEKVMLVK